MESATNAGPGGRPSRPLRPSRRVRMARLPLEHRLPLVIGTLVLIAIAALVAVAYAEMRRTSLRTASERLAAVTTQLRDMFQQSSQQIRGQLGTTAKAQPVLAFTRARTPATRENALKALAAAQTNPVIATEIRDSTGAVLLSATQGTLRVDTVAVNDVLPAMEP